MKLLKSSGVQRSLLVFPVGFNYTFIKQVIESLMRGRQDACFHLDSDEIPHFQSQHLMQHMRFLSPDVGHRVPGLYVCKVLS